MTTPFDPSKPSADGSPTEPVPPIQAAPAVQPVPPAQSVPTFAPAPVEPTTVPAPAINAGPTLVPAPVKPAAKSGGVSILNVALGVAVLVATAGVAFAVGRTTAPTTAAAQVTANGGNGGRFFTNGNGPSGSFAPPAGGFGNGNGNGGRGLGFAGAGGLSITGTVDSITDDSVTIKTSTGNTVTIGLDSSTTYHQQADATASDVTAGKTVILQVGAGGFRPGGNNGNGNGNNGNGNGNASPGTGAGNGNGNSLTLGTASDVTVVP